MQRRVERGVRVRREVVSGEKAQSWVADDGGRGRAVREVESDEVDEGEAEPRSEGGAGGSVDDLGRGIGEERGKSRLDGGERRRGRRRVRAERCDRRRTSSSMFGVEAVVVGFLIRNFERRRAAGVEVLA
jgi:hypothetical protein